MNPWLIAAIALIVVAAVVLLAFLWAGAFDRQLEGWLVS